MSTGDIPGQQMQLAQADGGGGGGSENLASSAGDKKQAASYMQEHLLPDTQAAGRLGEGGGQVHPPMVASGSVQSSFMKPDTGLTGLSAWATDAGLSSAMTVWQGQVNGLIGRLSGELSALRGAGNLFQNQDIGTGSQFNMMNTGQPPVSSSLGDL